ncbi:MAG: hypothetical protein MJE12_20865 [Alphaproteobacteria bacterium]|nr:hypothetical protein [Alphaproteobacteria bacterium]
MALRKCGLVAIYAVLGGVFAAGPSGVAADSYNPAINPKDFTTKINNPYFSMPVGKKLVYQAKTGEGLERIEITIPGDTKKIMGVDTLVYLDREFVDGELVEETRDYIAQDKDGNVWYFGEDVDNYENGKLKDHDGAWLAGVDGAKPGFWIKARHVVGDSYRQEYYKGEAEDQAKIVATGVTVKTKARTYKNCTKTYDWTALDPEAKEHKYYCPAAGAAVLIENLTTGERVELVKVETAK